MNEITGKWVMDPAESNVTFAVRYLVSKIVGSFGQFEGEANVHDDIAASTVAGTVDVTTINTGDEERDAQIRSTDFFDVVHYPAMRFKTHEWNKSEVSDEITLEGELTIKDVAHPVTLTGRFGKVETDDEGVTTARLELETTIDRKDWGLVWDSPADKGGVILGDEVTIVIDAKAVRVDPPEEITVLAPEPVLV